ncbi:fatty acid CoA ligase family protein [Singulisphaera sp. PoT]|uniref:fatty acid CoA ligase family protein n=1 Tax=Singulisphaera sp. PoT TaxID=3411797 RepID=UPI003BF5D67A
MARRRGDALAVIWPARGERLTFLELDALSDRMARGLRTIGIDRGVRTVVMVKPSVDFFALTFALFKLGAVPVLIDPGMGFKNLKQCIREAAPEAFIGIPKAQAARQVLGWGKETLTKLVTAGRRWPGGGPTLAQLTRVGASQKGDEPVMARPETGETAAILFTSGSTGIPKGVVYSHAIFNRQVELLRGLYGIEPGEVDLCTFPLFALFGPALGMTSIIPEMDATRPAQVDPTRILGAIEEFKVTNMFGSPALIRRVGEYGAAHGARLSTLRRAISAGAPVPAEVLATFAGILEPSALIHTPYGATEALPVCSISSALILGETRQRTDEGAGVCVGTPVDGVTVRIIKISDEPIASWDDSLLVPDGEIGEIVVQGTNVTREYFHRPESTALAKIEAEPGRFYHRMGDLGYRDDRGRIWFCGRKAHRVVTERGPLFTIPCEAVFNTHPAVFRTALVGVGVPGRMRPVLCVELNRPANGERVRIDLDSIRRELLEVGRKYPHTRDIDMILYHPAFPVDIRHNAKIFREKLAVWAARKLK